MLSVQLATRLQLYHPWCFELFRYRVVFLGSWGHCLIGFGETAFCRFESVVYTLSNLNESRHFTD